MPRRDAPPLTRGVVLRAFLLLVAVVLGGAAAWLIVTGTDTTPKRIQLGVLAGLWSALLGGFAMFGSRRSAHPLEDAYYSVAPTATEPAELDRAEEAAARRAFEARLEQVLRTELQTAVTREVLALRSEIADLRNDLLGEGTPGWGRARLSEPAAMRQIVEPTRVRPVRRETGEVIAVPTPSEAEQREPGAEPAPGPAGVEFAGLPRIRRFTEFELDPIEDKPAYRGRRRRVEDENGGNG